MTVRPAVASDAEGVVSLWDRAAGSTSAPADVPGVLRLLARDPDALLLAVEDDALVGTILVGWDGWRCNLYRLAVEPSHRRAGVASALLDAAAARAVALGAPRLYAMVADANEGGVGFWSASGFRRDPDGDHRWTRRVQEG